MPRSSSGFGKLALLLVPLLLLSLLAILVGWPDRITVIREEPRELELTYRGSAELWLVRVSVMWGAAGGVPEQARSGRRFYLARAGSSRDPS